MAADTYQLTPEAAAVYEEQKVAAIFRPLAAATLDAIAVDEADTVLDVACGTGIVARVVRARCRPKAPIAGIDRNAAMIVMARRLTRADAAAFRWHVGDAAGMPFADASFSLTICQQGLQYLPDERAALGELRRVLRRRGRVALTLWANPSPFFTALAEALERHVSAAVARQSLAPFSSPLLAALPGALEHAGFAEVGVIPLTVDRIVRHAEASIPKEILGNPVGTAVAARGAETMRLIVSDVIVGCLAFRHGADLIVPQTAALITARVR